MLERAGILSFPPRGKIRSEFVIGFVEGDNHMAGHFLEKMIESRSIQKRTGWIVRVREKYNSSVFVDCLKNCVEVNPILPHGRFHQLRSRGMSRHCVHDERTLARHGVQSGREQSLAKQR